MKSENYILCFVSYRPVQKNRQSENYNFRKPLNSSFLTYEH